MHAPFKLVVELDPVIERFIRILDASGRLHRDRSRSPTNKCGQGLEAYREKRSKLLGAGVNLVEVDLVRQGDWRALLHTAASAVLDISQQAGYPLSNAPGS